MGLKLEKAVTLVLVSAFLSPLSHGDTLAEELFWLNRLGQGFETDTASVEKQYLKLLDTYEAPDDVGRIYAAIGKMHANAGLTDPDAAAEYAQRALGLPLDPLTQMQTWVVLGDASQVQYSGVTGNDLARARAVIVRHYLEGIKVAADLGMPNEKTKVPMAGFLTWRGPPDDPEYLTMKERNDKLVAAGQEARRANEFFDRRQTLEGQIVFLYTRWPLATDELRRIAKEILENDSAVESLLAKVKAGIDERIAKMAERDIKRLDLAPEDLHGDAQSLVEPKLEDDIVEEGQTEAAMVDASNEIPIDSGNRSDGHFSLWMLVAPALMLMLVPVGLKLRRVARRD